MATFIPKKKRTSELAAAAQTQKSQISSDLVQELVVLGRIGAAYGVRGWMKIHPFSHSPDALIQAKSWCIAPYIPDQKVTDASWQLIKPTQIKPHADAWVATCMEWTDRTQAENFKGWQIAIPRSEFPQPQEDEFYWVDLMDAQVINQDGVVLGVVVGLLETAAHAVMQIRSMNSADTEQGSSKPTEYLIPFVSAFVGDVDLQNDPKTIAVTWDVSATA